MRRFTLRNVESASRNTSTGIPRPCAIAIAAHAFNTLWFPAAANSKSPNGAPRYFRWKLIPASCGATLLDTQSFCEVNPYVSTGQNAFDAAARNAGPDCSASPQIPTPIFPLAPKPNGSRTGPENDPGAGRQFVQIEGRVNIRVIVFQRSD